MSAPFLLTALLSVYNCPHSGHCGTYVPPVKRTASAGQQAPFPASSFPLKISYFSKIPVIDIFNGNRTAWIPQFFSDFLRNIYI